jgi:predicted GNAT family acetyltransferase
MAPAGLEIREIDATDGLRDSEALLIEAYDVPNTAPGSIYGPGVLEDPAYRLWVGYADGVPVSTSTAYLSDGLVGVYNVATSIAVRGHGYGEALTWRATLAEPSLPAVLESSAMGRPIYERMGYRIIAFCEVWEHAVQR